jgi:hypothetical protein
MKQKIAVLIKHGVVGLSALLAFTGQAMATTSDFKSQATSVNANFGDGFFNPQPQICGDCKYSIPEKLYFPETFFYGTLPPSFDNENKYSIPEKNNYGNISSVEIGSVFGINKDEFSHRNGAHSVPEKSIKRRHEWDVGDDIGDELGHAEDDLNVSPVPEADEWALMLAGFGLIGFVARRRKRNDALALLQA